MNVEKMTPEGLLFAAVVFLGLIIAYNAIMTAIEHRRKEKAHMDEPITELKKHIGRHDDLLQKDKDRLDVLDLTVIDLGEATRILLRQAMAVNAHMISGNDVSKLKESNDEIQQYLISRK